MTITLFCCYRSHIALLLSNSLCFSPHLSPLLFPLSPPPSLPPLSDYIIKEKTVLLQKKDNEGFGFVLRGAKGEPPLQNSPHLYCPHRFLSLMCSFSLSLSCSNLFIPPSFSNPCSCYLCPLNLVLPVLSSSAQTPIEEFTPTPAFPALQYLESVDEGGVAWRAGLRMGDFLIEVKTQMHFDPNSQINLKS